MASKFSVYYNMIPCLAIFNFLNYSIRNTGFLMDIKDSFSFVKFFFYECCLFFINFAYMVVASMRFVSTPFGKHIFHIIKLTTNPKMIGINTKRGVALVADILIYWYFSFISFIHQSMNCIFFSFNAENRIIVFNRAFPYPAIRCFINERFEVFVSIYKMIWVNASKIIADAFKVAFNFMPRLMDRVKNSFYASMAARIENYRRLISKSAIPYPAVAGGY